jgi:hypothetical protein
MKRLTVTIVGIAMIVSAKAVMVKPELRART